MEKKYFCFNKDYEMKPELGLKESFVIPAHQPILVERIFEEKEYEHVFLIDRIGGDPTFQMGYFEEKITKDQEIEMWKLTTNYAKSIFRGWMDSDVRTEMSRCKQIQEMWGKLDKQEEVIKALRLSIKYFDEQNQIKV